MLIMDGQDQCLNNKRIFTQNSSYYQKCVLVSPSGTSTSHWNLMAWIFFQHLKTNFSYQSYTDGHRMNIYALTIYIIHGPFDDIMLNHNLWLDVGCDFIDGTKAILVVNVDCNYFIIANWNYKLTV
jgi:hypothetical protein